MGSPEQRALLLRHASHHPHRQIDGQESAKNLLRPDRTSGLPFNEEEESPPVLVGVWEKNQSERSGSQKGYFLGYATLDLEEDDLDNGSGCTSPAPNQILVAKGDEPNLASQVSGVTFGAETTEENRNTSSVEVTKPNVGILPKDEVGMKQP
ncbi:hypothetical protein U1Q18_014557 [Sarracenia purpurea var. burkii]